jgi:hypothetical protein
MKKTKILIPALLIAGLALFAYENMGANAFRRSTQHALDTFSNALSTKQIGKLSSAFKSYIANNAKIHLEVSFVTLQNMQNNTPEIQDFDKANFYIFIDNVLYSMQDYSADFHIEDFKLDAAKHSADVTFTCKGVADSELNYGELHTNTHFTANSLCDAVVTFDAEMHPTLGNTSCKVKITSTPKLASGTK